MNIKDVKTLRFETSDGNLWEARELAETHEINLALDRSHEVRRAMDAKNGIEKWILEHKDFLINLLAEEIVEKLQSHPDIECLDISRKSIVKVLSTI